MSRTIRHDVHWHAPGRKRPIAYSTTATSDLIRMLAREDHTVDSALAAVNYDPDAIDILSRYAELGHGPTTLIQLGIST